MARSKSLGNGLKLADTSIYASDEWSGFELVYLLKGALTIEDEEEGDITLAPGDFLHHNGLPEKVYFRVGEEAEFLMISSSPSFHLMRDGVDDMTELARSVEEKDAATDGHCARLERLAIQTSERLGLVGQTLIDISYGAYLHDIGKIKVPDEILGKAASLTEAEWEEMKRHPDYGAEMLNEREFPVSYTHLTLPTN